MNIQVATSELPISSVRGGPRLSGVNYTQRPQTRFRGSRGPGSIRGNFKRKLITYSDNLCKLIKSKICSVSHSYIFCSTREL